MTVDYLKISDLKASDFTIVMSGGEWIMKINMETGQMQLNPEIPQDEAIYGFAKALNSWIGVYYAATKENVHVQVSLDAEKDR